MKQKGKDRLRLIGHFIRGSFLFFMVGLTASAINTVFSNLVPQVVRATVDSILGDEPFQLGDWLVGLIEQAGGREYFRSHILWVAAAVMGLTVLSGAFTFLARVFTAKGSEGLAKRIRDELFGHIQRLPYSWHVKNQTGDIIQRATSDVETMRSFISQQLIQVFRTVFLIFFAIWMMFSMDVRLSLVAMVFIPVVVFYSAYFSGKISTRFQEADEAEAELSAAVQENLTGVRVVRAFGREAHEIERFDKKNTAFAELWIKLSRVMGLYWGVGDFFAGLQVMVILVLGTLMAVKGEMTVGTLIAFISYNATLVWPIRGLGRVLSEMSKAGVSIDRINYILNEPEERDDPAGQTPEMDRDIVFDHVTFGYEEGQNILTDVSFPIKAGSTFAVLGGTGSGKSTLVHLLDRLYDLSPAGGSITVGGVDIRDMKLSWVRRNVGMVLQEPFLFSRTIRENISAFRPQAELGEIREMARIAHVDDSIEGFAEGYDTVVGERGVTLSGGQKQRVAIARMLLQKAPIMVFDDSLSAVDAETDYQIREALKNQLGGATVILISHRITTLMQADQILVLQDGRVAQLGNHEELIHQPGIYQDIYNIQMSREGLLDEEVTE